jgi:hypothetical protein
MTAKLTFRPGMPPLSWGHPDSPRRPLCAVCDGALPEQAIVMFTEQGFCAAFCDPCVEPKSARHGSLERAHAR